ncbi:helix-turn-helix domain-containing protein [Pyrococcus kukulkanii]|uniref:helix-turn-helix domain-containing protein n=1 Tax=Pyrococcus kukulkanii TaxID=1609559 RepID=UPI003566BE5E
MLVILHSEGANVRESIKNLNNLAQRKFPPRGKVTTSKIKISMGAFLSVSIMAVFDLGEPYKPGIIVDYAVSGNKEKAIEELQEKLNSKIAPDMEIKDFSLETYTTPVTRRTYAVAVILYNRPVKSSFEELKLQNRRKILAKLLELVNFNPKALNISELARMFGVSRDTIYNDIQQILKGQES